jgi:Protein of unknown function (DUF4231)
MTEAEYFEQRLTDQINWYDKKSGHYKKLFMRFKVTEIVLALLIPLLTGYITTEMVGLKVFVGLLGVIVAVAASLLTLYKFQENWIEYRTVSEQLKYEKYLYLAKAGIYKEKRAFADFVERIEGILSAENAKWVSYNSAQKDEEATEEKQTIS